MPEIDQRLGEVRDHAFGSTVPPWRDGFVWRSDLCDAHLSPCAACKTGGDHCGFSADAWRIAATGSAALSRRIRHRKKHTRLPLVASKELNGLKTRRKRKSGCRQGLIRSLVVVARFALAGTPREAQRRPGVSRSFRFRARRRRSSNGLTRVRQR
jgi:hypothetical protein